MQSTTTAPETEPTPTAYPDTMEGMLQHIADTSLYYQVQVTTAKTAFKRDFYKKKLAKNNNKLYRYLVRTPNAYNPLMKYLEPTPAAPEDTVEYDKDGEEIVNAFHSADQTEAVAVEMAAKDAE